VCVDRIPTKREAADDISGVLVAAALCDGISSLDRQLAVNVSKVTLQYE
jgi:hypothetical protein